MPRPSPRVRIYPLPKFARERDAMEREKFNFVGPHPVGRIAFEPDDTAVLDRPELARWIEVMSLDVERAIDSGCASFRMKLKPSLFPFVPPQSVVEIFYGDRLVLLGRIDAVRINKSKTGSELEVGGRDLTADLVDCTPNVEVSEWADIPIEDLARELASPYRISVIPPNPAFPVPSIFHFKIGAGETCWAAIERACRIRAVLAFSTPEGHLRIERPVSDERTEFTATLTNWESAELEINDADRFQFYGVSSQQSGSETIGGDATMLVEASSLDFGVKRNRRLTVLCESAAGFDDAATRAQWEATFRAARSRQLRLTVVGWENSNGATVSGADELWRLNTMVYVEVFGVKEALLLGGIAFRYGAGGVTTELSLMRPDAFIPQPEVSSDDPFATAFENEEEP